MFEFAYLARGRDSVHYGHGDIHEYDIEFLRCILIPLQSLKTVSGDGVLIANLLHVDDKELA